MVSCMAGSEPWTTSPTRVKPRAVGSAGARCCQPCYNGGSRNKPNGLKPGGEIRVEESAGLTVASLEPVGFFICEESRAMGSGKVLLFWMVGFRRLSLGIH